MSIKRELTALRNTVSTICPHSVLASSTSQQNTDNNVRPTSVNQLVITSWNCRGYNNAGPYLNQLIDDGADVIALCEHWLWPFNLPKLSQIHPDYSGLGRSDKRLHDQSTLSRGCGGVGLIWRSSHNATPINIDSDRICGIQLQHGDCTLSILCVYLPSSDHSLEEFST